MKLISIQLGLKIAVFFVQLGKQNLQQPIENFMFRL